MADFEAPSFSLGLDFDDTPPPSPSTSPNHDPLPQVPDSDPDPETLPNPPLHILKRLRRGPPSSSKTDPPSCIDVDDDDIEEFSSQEDPVQGQFFYSYLNYHRNSQIKKKGIC